MKKINILAKWIITFIFPFLLSCEFDYPTALVNPDLGFSKTGLQIYYTNSEYSDAVALITISRTYGLSKEIEMLLEVDEALVKEYNELYSSNYSVMESKYYTFPNTITFPENTQEVEVAIRINPNALVEDYGYEKGSNIILPIKLVSANITADFPQNSNSILLNPRISAPMITVDTSASTTLSFPNIRQLKTKDIDILNCKFQ